MQKSENVNFNVINKTTLNVNIYSWGLTCFLHWLKKHLKDFRCFF